MAAAITVTCGNVDNGTGDIRAKIDAIHVKVTGADVYNADGTQKRFRLRLEPPSGLENDTLSGYSHLFAPSALGEHWWDGYVFPGSGAWAIELYDEEQAGSAPDTIVSSSIANPTVITTSAAHGLTTGETVTIAGHSGSTPDINGTHVVTVIDATTYSIPVNVTADGTGGTAASGGVIVSEAVTVI